MRGFLLLALSDIGSNKMDVQVGGSLEREGRGEVQGIEHLQRSFLGQVLG